MIFQVTLPENLVAKCLDVLRILSSDERDLIRVVVEVAHDLRDPSDGDKSMMVRFPQHSFKRNSNRTIIYWSDTPMTVKGARAFSIPVSEMSDEEKRKADGIDLGCLSLCIGMLERVHGVRTCLRHCHCFRTEKFLGRHSRRTRHCGVFLTSSSSCSELALR